MAKTVLSLFGLTPLRIGGTERYCLELSMALQKLGWQSVLGFEGEVNPLVQDYLQGSNVAFERLPAMTAGGATTVLAVRKLLRKHRPKVLHLHYTGFVTPFPWLATLTGACNTFLTSHASYQEGFRPRKTAALKRPLARIVNAPLRGVVCPSEFGRRCLIETGTFPEARIKRIYNGTHVTNMTRSEECSQRFRRLYNIAPEAKLIIQVGQLIPEKGVSDLLTAFNIAAGTNGTMHLAYVGEGSQRSFLENQVVKWHLEDRVTFTGLIQDIDESGVFEACDVCCLASRWEELFGFVLVEAMARAKPVVATRVGGIPEVVIDAKTGYLVDRGDTKAMAARLLELAEQPGLCTSMGLAGRGRVAEFFDVQKNVQEVLELYDI